VDRSPASGMRRAKTRTVAESEEFLISCHVFLELDREPVERSQGSEL
jgi:hypothetical protein